MPTTHFSNVDSEAAVKSEADRSAEALLGEPEPWEAWETQLVTWSIGIAIVGLVILGFLINTFILS